MINKNMACYKCEHTLKDHNGGSNYAECTKCDCKEYGPSEFECTQCGRNFNEQDARAGYDFCEPCSKKYNNGNRFIPC